MYAKARSALMNTIVKTETTRPTARTPSAESVGPRRERAYPKIPAFTLSKSAMTRQRFLRIVQIGARTGCSGTAREEDNAETEDTNPKTPKKIASTASAD